MKVGRNTKMSFTHEGREDIPITVCSEVTVTCGNGLKMICAWPPSKQGPLTDEGTMDVSLDILDVLAPPEARALFLKHQKDRVIPSDGPEATLP